MSFIHINHVSKSYGNQVVLENLNCHVEQGDFITIVGASGCGKTTFLNMLLGTENPSSGNILLQGEPLADEPNEDRGIVFQRYSVFPHMTAIENVMLSRELEQSRILGRLTGARKKEVYAEAASMLEAVGLEAALDKYPHQLSGGMQQRLALAQSLIKKPRILLLDEPFGALDPGIRADMHQLVLKLRKEQQLTIFMITHDISEGFYLGTRLWVFDKERIDPHEPSAYGAKITYDITAGEVEADILDQIETNLH